MGPAVLLNESRYQFSENDFPLLIHGAEHSGSSFFTLVLLVDLYMQDKKFVFFCKSEKAQINFLQLLTDQSKIEKIRTSDQVTKEILAKQNLLIEPSNYKLFLSITNQLDSKTIVVIKNIDSMPEEVFDSIKSRANVVISGNIDRCIYKEKILEKQWNTKILFSSLEAMMANIPDVEQYEAIFLGQKTSGVVSVK